MVRSAVLVISLTCLVCRPCQAQPSRELVYSLQRVLNNGCRQRVARDGLLGPRTLNAYRLARERFG